MLFQNQFRRRLSEVQREIVQTRLRALWDYANSPEQKSRSAKIAALLFIAYLVVFFLFGALALVVGYESPRWLAPASQFVTGQGWRYFVRNDSAASVIPLFAVMALAFSVHRFCTDSWPRALQAELVSGLRRKTFDSDKVDTYRQALEKDVLKGEVSPFDPRRFLLRLRLRISRRFYLGSAVLLVLSVVVVWRSAYSYTIVTDQGFDVAPFFSIEKSQYRYSDVQRAQVDCGRTSYEVEFSDGRSAELWSGAPMRTSIASIDWIDHRLRRVGTKFVIIVDKRGVLGVRQCVSSLAHHYGHADALARIMHQDE